MSDISSETDNQTAVQTLHETLEHGTLGQVNALLDDLHPSEIADALESLPPKQRETLWEETNLPQGEVLPYLEDAVRTDLMEAMPATEVAQAAKGMDLDDAVDVLQDLPDARVEEVLQALDSQYRQHLTQVLFYPEASAGGLMNIDTLTVRPDVTLNVVLRYLRSKSELPEKTDMLMVVDRNNYLVGGLPLSTILTHAPSLTVGEVMQTDVNAIAANLPENEVARLFEQRDLLSAPVVDDNNRLVGRITIDDVVDVIRAEADHRLMGRAGLDEEDDMFAPVITTARNRAVWLGVNLLTAFLAAWVIGLFEGALAQIVALAVLMPVVASMGGIAGTQTLTVVIRGMALGKVTNKNTPWLLRKELAVSVFNGFIWALVVAAIAIVWFKSVWLGVIIGTAIVVNLFFAALSGIVVPLLLKRLSIDPALAGGVILTTVTDVIGFATFLGLATVFLLG